MVLNCAENREAGETGSKVGRGAVPSRSAETGGEDRHSTLGSCE